MTDTRTPAKCVDDFKRTATTHCRRAVRDHILKLERRERATRKRLDALRSHPVLAYWLRVDENLRRLLSVCVCDGPEVFGPFYQEREGVGEPFYEHRAHCPAREERSE